MAKKPDNGSGNGNGRERALTRGKKASFLAAFAASGNLTVAALAAKMSRRTHYTWLATDPEYPALFKEAQDIACDALENEANRRAVKGLRRFKFHLGNAIIDPESLMGCQRHGPNRVSNGDTTPCTCKPYVEHEYSDTLLIFLMKGNLPKKYGQAVTHQTNVQVTQVHSEQHVLNVSPAQQQQLDHLGGLIDDAAGESR